jgi:4'-phosphopantetheinyl transferase EntD
MPKPLTPDSAPQSALEEAVSRLLEDHAFLHARVQPIRAGDEHALTAAEARYYAEFPPHRRRASGSVRGAARMLCAALGLGQREFACDADGVPAWPEGWIGSFSHDGEAAIAVLGRSPPLQGLGVDIEAPGSFGPELTQRVLAEGEGDALAAAGVDGKTAFCVKEAVFKATFPRDRLFLAFWQIRLDPATRTALTASGRSVHWRAIAAPRRIALAWW